MSEKELIEKDLEEKALQQQAEQIKNLERYHFLKEHGYILFETITGSQAHGTNTPKSDIDKAFVYILPKNDILGLGYKEQLKIHKDFMGYEIRRFLELLRTGNPTVLELLYSPKDCVLIMHPAFDILLQKKDTFITKVCENSFYGYAKQQRQKAEGLEKLQNWESQRVVKKNPLDFCYVPVGYDSIPMKRWLQDHGMEQLFCALTAISHCKDLFAVFYDWSAHECFSEMIPEKIRETTKEVRKAQGLSMGIGYKGIAFEDSNDIRLSNIPLEERKKSVCHMSYSKDSYRKHCIDYKRYEKWLEDRNENRWVEIKGHGQQIDGKNMMHFMRLVMIGREIAQGKGMNIRRPDAQELLKIRRGEVSLQELFDKSDEILSEMKTIFQNSILPDEVSFDFINKMLIRIREYFYRGNARDVIEMVDFNNKVISNERTNPFMLKAFGEKSELHHMLFQMLSQKVEDSFGGDYESFLSEENQSYIMGGIPKNSDLWPMTVNKVTGKKEKIGTDFFSVKGVWRDKIAVVCGGENQVKMHFYIVAWGEQFAAIKIKTAKQLNESKIDVFELIGFK